MSDITRIAVGIGAVVLVFYTVGDKVVKWILITILTLLSLCCAQGEISDLVPPSVDSADCTRARIFDAVKGLGNCQWWTQNEIQCGVDGEWVAGLSDPTHATLRYTAHSQIQDVCYIRIHGCVPGGTETHCDPEWVWQ